jgi:PAS domain S-box-containing protein
MDHTFRILIIEDDPDTRANLRDILELDGHEVFAVASFHESESIANDHEIGLVITDRRLPDGMIEDFLPRVKANSSGAKIIVITGYGDMQSTIAAFRLGVTDYVIKPIIPDDIRSIVNRLAEKHSLQTELAEEHHFIEEVLKTAEAIVLVLDVNGRVIRFNPFFEQLTGWPLGELAGSDWFENCIPQEERVRIKEVFIRTAHDVHTRDVVNDVLGRDGSHHKIRWSNTTLKRVNGTVHAVLAVGVDITDLAEAQSRSLQAERLAAIGQTMTALAHESRNVLQRIRAASDVLAMEIAGNPDAQESLDVIQRASNDLQCLLEELRSFAAPIQVHLNPAHLPMVWQRAWEDIATIRAGRDAKLVESLETSDLNVEIDNVRMEQVFRNLFENSLAASTDPVRIHLDCRCGNGWVELLCRDNGPGLNDEQKQKLFEPFYTTKKSGTGLGMPICQRIIEAHGGTIQIQPSNGGACFLIRLPRLLPEETTLPSKHSDEERYPISVIE